MFSKIAILLGCIAIAHSALIPTGYNFGYNIDGATDGQSREEKRDENGNVVGFYTLRDADGRSRRVNYRAGADGFHADIDSNEPGILPKSAANAKFNGAELPKAPEAGQFEHYSPLAAEPLTTGELLVPTGYKFGYDIQGPSDSQSREESGEHGKVTGSYALRDTDGRFRKVDYIADDKGFRATINTNEQGTANKSPADVSLQSPHAAPLPVEPLPAIALELPQAPALTQTVVHSAPVFEYKAPLTQEYVRPALAVKAPSTQEYIKAPITQEYIKSAPAAVYTSKSHSSISFAKAPVAQAPIEQAPIKQAPIQQVYEKPKEIFQESIKSAPVEQKYTSSSYSKINFEKKLEIPQAPITQQIRVDPLPVKSAQTFVAPAPLYKSSVHSSVSYAKAPAAQEQLPLKGQLVQEAPWTKSLETKGATKSFETKIEHSQQKVLSSELKTIKS